VSRTRNIVVDTDVLRSAGDLGLADSRPVLCSRFLTAVLWGGYGIVLTAELLAEWRRHRSRFATRWLRTMFARRRVVRVQPADSGLRARAVHLSLPRTLIDALLKDVHLVDAALAADKLIASMDETTRSILREVIGSGECQNLSDLCWVNPERDDVIDWLRDGARSIRPFRLDVRPD